MSDVVSMRVPMHTHFITSPLQKLVCGSQLCLREHTHDSKQFSSYSKEDLDGSICEMMQSLNYINGISPDYPDCWGTGKR